MLIRCGSVLITLLITLSGLVLTTGIAGVAHAQDGIQVGVVVKGQGGAEATYCVTLPPDKATGLDALRATNLDLNLQAGPLGAAVCRLDHLGCTYPADTCFCQCQGGTCRHWAYLYQTPEGRWQYSSFGALSRKLKTGDVEGWLWSEGQSKTPTGSLSNITFDAICKAAATPTAADSSGAAPATSIATIAGYGALGALVVGIGGVLLWRRRRTR
jgi:hypothetical protein